MFCGTGSFKSVESDPWTTPPSSPKKKASKNPYSARGLDKFSELLSDLEARRARIMATARSQGVRAMVRFTYSNSDDWIPIIVKLRDPAADAAKPSDVDKSNTTLPPPQEVVGEASPPEKEMEAAPERKSKESFSWCTKARKGWSWNSLMPTIGWHLVVVLMLVCLVTFGKAFAICCTTVWWYMLPIMQGESDGSARKPLKKKDYGRKLSDKRITGKLGVAPSFQGKKVRGAQEVSSPRGHGNGGRRG